jgi:hypothetical protein
MQCTIHTDVKPRAATGKGALSISIF